MDGFKKGDTIILHGKVKAGQDMGYHDFDFGSEGKEFRVAAILAIPPEHSLKLTADGYGESDNYGNGCLFVTFEEARKASTAPVQPDKEEWQPEVGKECFLDNEGRASIIAIDGKFAWVQYANSDIHITKAIKHLKPLPPEPPVEVGDIWVDKLNRRHWFVNLTGKNPWGTPQESINNWGGEGGPCVALNPKCHEYVGNMQDHLQPSKEQL